MQLDLASVNKAFIFSNHTFARSASDINYGECYLWAFCVYCLYGSTLGQTMTHAFVKIGKKYFDSEALDGVDSWEELRICKEVGDFSYHEFPRDIKFQREWKFSMNAITPILADVKKIMRAENALKERSARLPKKNELILNR